MSANQAKCFVSVSTQQDAQSLTHLLPAPHQPPRGWHGTRSDASTSGPLVLCIPHHVRPPGEPLLIGPTSGSFPCLHLCSVHMCACVFTCGVCMCVRVCVHTCALLSLVLTKVPVQWAPPGIPQSKDPMAGGKGGDPWTREASGHQVPAPEGGQALGG